MILTIQLLPQPSLAETFDYHFDRAVGKFVDETNQYIVGTSVDEDVRDIQKTAVKILIDPRSEKTSEYLDEMTNSIENVYGKYQSSSRKASRSRKGDFCYYKFETIVKEISRMKNKGGYAPYEIDDKVDKYYINVLECYMNRKEYNHAISWVNMCEKNNIANNIAKINYSGWEVQVRKLKMILKGKNDDW